MSPENLPENQAWQVGFLFRNPTYKAIRILFNQSYNFLEVKGHFKQYLEKHLHPEIALQEKLEHQL